uniref:DUF1850 domain-containing protein n=1 Tax=uncultured Allobacillus sp. TaxID=1638025 RepID=UPI00259A41F9|nr:DUF1850 domain-containing protein [uncultured Allobacillus sp.]
MNNKWLMRGAIILLPLIFLSFLIRIPVIELKTSEQVYFLRDDTFTLTWIHSVEKEPWYEVYEREKGQLLLTETYFKTFGAGVPSSGDVQQKNDGFVHMEVNRTMKELNVVVSENVQTTMITEDKDIELYQMVEPYTEVNVSVRNLYLWNLFGGKFL